MATLPTPATVAVGQKISASLWNAQVYTSGNFALTTKPVCHVYTGTAQSTATGSWTTITFETEVIDTDNQHSTVTNTSQINIGKTLGWYKLTGQIVYSSTVTTGSRRGIYRLNGSGTSSTGIIEESYVSIQASTSTWTVLTMPHIYVRSTASTDYIDLVAWHDAGSALALQTGAGIKTWLAAEYIGPLQ